MESPCLIKKILKDMIKLTS